MLKYVADQIGAAPEAFRSMHAVKKLVGITQHG
jgi:hypothetical protein